MKSNKLNLLVSILLGIVLLVVWLKIIDWQEFIRYFQTSDLYQPLLFSFFYIFAYFLRSLRWKIILKPIRDIPLLESFAVFMSGMILNYLIPVRAGEIAKSFILKIKHRLEISRTLPTVFIDKLADLFPIILIIILIPIITIRLNSLLYIIIFIITLIFLVFIILLLIAIKNRIKAVAFLNKMLFFLPARLKSRYDNSFINFVDGLTILRGRYLTTFLVSMITALAVLSEAVYIHAVFKAFGSDISYWEILFGYTLLNLTYILPTPPAQIGSNQFTWVLIFSFALRVNENLTSAAVTFSHLLTSIIIFLLGSISLLALKIKFVELVQTRKKKRGSYSERESGSDRETC
jgi:uncharacterized protein (TIRG00374 family)